MSEQSTNITDRDCFWCRDVAAAGPFEFEGYDSDVYLCDLCEKEHDDKIRLVDTETDQTGGGLK